ncbi:unnamed protein product [Hydatigera taeniaeformis]|uniref:Ig-like domain-containing protein n=1 Tax=Hydatigena taeniaeformis TaxID=6205 RepID=A0A0R3WR96_HYDTA|nr:unnamed protein product [Hydatigera taeniaeformis]
MINLATETGHVTLRNYFIDSFPTKLYCERVMNGDPVDIPIRFTIYRQKPSVPKLKSIYPKAYFYNGNDEVNSRYTFFDENWMEMEGLTNLEKPTNTGVEIDVFHHSDWVFSHKEMIPTIDIKAVKVQIEGAREVFLLTTQESEEVITCRVSGTELPDEDDLPVKWSFSQIFYHPAPPLIDGAKIVLNDKVGEGTFCMICTIPLLESSTPTNETCFAVLRKYLLPSL